MREQWRAKREDPAGGESIVPNSRWIGSPQIFAPIARYARNNLDEAPALATMANCVCGRVRKFDCRAVRAAARTRFVSRLWRWTEIHLSADHVTASCCVRASTLSALRKSALLGEPSCNQASTPSGL